MKSMACTRTMKIVSLATLEFQSEWGGRWALRFPPPISSFSRALAYWGWWGGWDRVCPTP